MQVIFGSGVATGKYAMESAEALGQPGDGIPHDDVEAYERGEDTSEDSSLDNRSKGEKKIKEDGRAPKRNDAEAYERGEDTSEDSSLDNRSKGEKKIKEDGRAPKRKNQQEEGSSSNGGLTEAINGLSLTVAEAEACKGIYKVVMNIPGFTRDQLICALEHFMDRKGAALVFMDMDESDRQLWVRRFVAKHY